MRFRRFLRRRLTGGAFVLLLFGFGRAGAEEPSPHPPEPVDRAIDAGLRWLERNQEADGSWDTLAHNPWREGPGLPGFCALASRGLDPGVTALVFLALLEARRDGSFDECAGRALGYLREMASDYLEFGGPPRSACICHSGYSISGIYNPPLVFLSLLRAGETASDDELRALGARGLAWLAATRDTRSGSCRFLPLQDSGVSVFVLEAILSARRSRIAIPAGLEDEAAGFWRRLIEPATGRVLHEDVNPQCLGGWDAIAISLSFQRAFDAGDTELACRQRQRLIEHPPTWCVDWRLPASDHPLPSQLILLDQDVVNYFYWYYATLALRSVGAESWARWRGQLVDALSTGQTAEGELAGSWPPDDPWGRIGGRVYSTAYAVRALAAAR